MTTTQARLAKIFKAYDVRGLSPGEFDEALAYRIGSGFARFCRTEQVVMGRDMRDTGVGLSRAFANGVIAQGVDVVDIGLASTDMVYFASGEMQIPGAMFTASHNPAEYNGIKMCLAGAAPLSSDSGLDEIRQLAAEESNQVAQPGLIRQLSILREFAAHVAGFLGDGPHRPLRVVADTANGMGGLVVPAVFELLPFEVEILYPELDGSFPNHPADPIQPENLVDLREAVLASSADLGLAFDGDADRVFLVDDLGVAVSGSTTTAMVADSLLSRNPGATVLYNLICSRCVPEVIVEGGGVPLRTRVGHSFIKAKMAESGALFAGEHSGHYYFRDNYNADSGLIAAVTILGLISSGSANLSQLRLPFERYCSSGEINTRVENIDSVLARVREHFYLVTPDEMDGLTFEFDDWWFNLRPSNTEPLLRLNLEASTPEACSERVEEVLSLVS